MSMYDARSASVSAPHYPVVVPDHIAEKAADGSLQWAEALASRLNDRSVDLLYDTVIEAQIDAAVANLRAALAHHADLDRILSLMHQRTRHFVYNAGEAAYEAGYIAARLRR